jgi:hypothetical protein
LSTPSVQQERAAKSAGQPAGQATSAWKPDDATGLRLRRTALLRFEVNSLWSLAHSPEIQFLEANLPANELRLERILLLTISYRLKAKDYRPST